MYWGAGGEPAGDTTIFDRSISQMRGFIDKSSKTWKIEAYANGGHPQTQMELEKVFQPRQLRGNISADHLEKQIADYKNKIERGEIKPGDKILLIIATHGYQNRGEKSHSISTNSGAAQTESFNLDELKQITELAESKKIKLGIIDLSCHSGGSLPLANSATCIISSSGPTQYATGSFAENFLDRLQPGKSLESIFLETRRSSASPAFPMISTPAGQSVNQKLYSKIQLYLNWPGAWERNDHFLESLLSRATCPRAPEAFSKLEDEIRTIAAQLGVKSPSIDRLLELMRHYDKKQRDAASALAAWGVKDLNQNESISQPDGTVVSESRLNLLTTPYGDRVNDLSSRLESETDPSKRDRLQLLKEHYESRIQLRAQLLERAPQLSNVASKYKALLNQLDLSQSQANEIALEERELYDALYREDSGKNTGPNPCRDFVL